MNNWQTGLYDCCDDCNICCYGCWCPSCLYGENAVQIDDTDYDEACCAYCTSGSNPLAVVWLTENRRAFREKYRLPEEPCGDCVVVSFCSPCALCQLARELKIRSAMPNVTQPQGNPMVFQPINNLVYTQPVVSTEPVSFIQLPEPTN